MDKKQKACDGAVEREPENERILASISIRPVYRESVSASLSHIVRVEIGPDSKRIAFRRSSENYGDARNAAINAAIEYCCGGVIEEEDGVDN